jgi:hypothetical protein
VEPDTGFVKGDIPALGNISQFTRAKYQVQSIAEYFFHRQKYGVRLEVPIC